MSEKLLKKCLVNFSNYETKEIEEKHVVNANESPFNIIEEKYIKEIILNIINNYNFNIYPDPNANELREELGKYLGIDKSNIICGNGGDEIISLSIMAYLEPDEYVIVNSPSFEMYSISSTINNGNIIRVGDKENFVIDYEKIIEEANKNKAKLVFLCTPNNPTGYMMPKEQIDMIIENTNSIVIVDEAYIEFSDYDSFDYIENDRVIIVRTLSKLFGLAGLRIGYGIGNKSVINNLNKVKPPFNVNGLTQKIATEILRNKELVLNRIEYFKNERKRIVDILSKFDYLKVFKSQSNFILIRIEESKIDEIMNKFKDNSILVKTYENREELKNCIRISISTEDVNNMIIDSLKLREDPWKE